MKRHVALFAGSLLAGSACLLAQQPALRGMPVVPPAIEHPGLINQPSWQPSHASAAVLTAPVAVVVPPAVPEGPDPATVGAKVHGKDLAKAVKQVKKLTWHDRLDEACTEALQEGKPVLWIQGLGELDGFA